jgi:RNA 3'-terminal phosphate cyclase (ATP)
MREEESSKRTDQAGIHTELTLQAGLKSQHVTSIQWLAEVTGAETEGLSVGSKTLTFIPRRRPTELVSRNFRIEADSGAASTLLILQAILPLLLFSGTAGGEDGGKEEPIVLNIVGGTNVSFSLSFEYLDQVLLPTLEERFGVRAERELKERAWSLGRSSGKGEISLKIYPLPRGQALHFRPLPGRYPPSPSIAARDEIKSVDVSIITSGLPQSEVQEHLVKHLGQIFPDADVSFKVTEDSGDVARWYILLVANSATGSRWGRDTLVSMPKKTRSASIWAGQVVRQVCKDLYEEVSLGGQVDEHLQDQVVVFQALSKGYSSLPRGDDTGEQSSSTETLLVDELGKLQIGAGGRMRREKAVEPFGHGSLHTQTARWVVSELLPGVKFFNKGDIVEGVGFTLS